MIDVSNVLMIIVTLIKVFKSQARWPYVRKKEPLSLFVNALQMLLAPQFVLVVTVLGPGCWLGLYLS